MVTAEDALEFCRKYYKKSGRPFSIEGRQWVRDELFVPFFGWKLWPRDPDNLCSKCRVKAGEIVNWTPALVRACARKSRCCGGLKLVKIMNLFLNLPRGSGKTMNTSALMTSVMTMEAAATVSFVAASGQQARTITEENLLAPVSSDPRLKKSFELRGNKLEFYRKGGQSSFFEVLDASPRSITSRRRQYLFFDESRDIEKDMVSALGPSIKAQSRFECPHGHSQIPYEPDKVFKCPVCKQVMEPRIPVMVFTSTSGRDTTGRFAWFDEYVTKRLANPTGLAHVFRETDTINPNISEAETEALADLADGSETLRPGLLAEEGNVTYSDGDEFLSNEDIEALFDPDFTPILSSESLCFGFLDTSLKADLTSLVIVSDADDSNFDQVVVAHVAHWDPKTLPNKIINPKDVLRHLELVIPRFPNLVELRFDTRGDFSRAAAPDALNKWPAEMVDHIRSGASEPLAAFKGRIKKFDGMFGSAKESRSARRNKLERSAAWMSLKGRILTRRISMAPSQIVKRELKNLAEKQSADLGIAEVYDRRRRLSHADIADGIANCCYMIDKHRTETAPQIGQTETMVEMGRLIDGDLEERYRYMT